MGCAVFAFMLVGCGSITPLDGADGGVSSPRSVIAPDAGRISVLTGDAGLPGDAALPSGEVATAAGTADAAPPPPATKDAGASASEAGGGGASGAGGRDDDRNFQSCVIKNNCPGLRCNVLTGLCIECLVNTDCQGKTKLCDPLTLTCLACFSTADCGGDKSCVLGACR